MTIIHQHDCSDMAVAVTYTSIYRVGCNFCVFKFNGLFMFMTMEYYTYSTWSTGGVQLLTVCLFISKVYVRVDHKHKDNTAVK